VAAGRSWKYGVAAAAAVALTLFALGPWAASGFAQNPISQVFDFVGEHAGVQGVDEPPTQVPATVPEACAQQAAERLGIPVGQPSYLPAGFGLASSAYYPKSVTTPEHGMFVQAYAPGGESRYGEPEIIVYQEQVTPSTIAQKNASIESVVIGGSLPATYVRGIWQASPDGTLEWVEDDAEVLVFDQNGVRTFIVYHFGEQEKDELLKIAESMLAQ
jgi:hypothetical protein